MGDIGLNQPAVIRLDMESYARRDHFDYFRAMDYPYMGTTSMLDITEFLRIDHEKGIPFFLSFLWCTARAANSVPELRRRIDGDGIVEFSSCHTSHTEAKPDGTYAYCTLDCDCKLEQFIPYARSRQSAVRENGNINEDENDALSLFFISSLPWLSYTALVQPVPKPADSNPRISWGRYSSENGRVFIPVSILCNHAIVDGIHISEFYKYLQNILREEYAYMV